VLKMTEDETLWPMDSELQTLAMLGSTIADRYKTERLLGEGGMGTVYLATDQLLGRQVAIKMMKA
jgi:serine/threonine protein kinase